MNFVKLVLFVVFLSGCVHVQLKAQDYTFKVLINKGKSEVKTEGKWQQVKIGERLDDKDELKVAENAYLGLMHVTGKPIEVRQAGTYKVADLASRISGGSSVLNKYTDFILSSNAKKGNNLAATGAVDRGTGIALHLPMSDRALIYSNEVIFDWDNEKIAGPYTVVLSSLFEDELHKTETKDNRIVINMDDEQLKNEDNILVYVVSQSEADRQSKKYTLRRLSKADHERISRLLEDTNLSMNESSALTKLCLAGFFEDNNLIIDAATAYQQAIMLAPDVPAYEEAYQDFLLRNALRKIPRKK